MLYPRLPISSSSMGVRLRLIQTCMTLTLSALCIRVSLDSFFLRTATLLSRCSLCLAYSACMSVSAAWSALAVCKEEAMHKRLKET